MKDMIRITLVTGAGKLGRQKYDEGAAKAVTTALRELGYQEDRGASCVPECAGSFKLQHDTGKNLKTVVIFPNILQPDDGTDGNKKSGSPTHSQSNNGSSSSTIPLLESGSPDEMIALSSITMFENLVKSRCPSWSQKKGCCTAIERIKTIMSDMETKLLQGTVLDDAQQEFFDAVSIDGLDKKYALVKDMMQYQVEGGGITDRERKQLLIQVTDRLEAIDIDLESAKAEQKPKKVEKLTQAKTKLEERKVMLSKTTPKQPAPLKHQNKILELRKELAPLIALQQGAKGRLLSLKETQSLARKDEIEDEILQLEQDSRGWFEDDDSIQDRIERCRALGKAQAKTAAKKTAAGTTATNSSRSSGGGSNAWTSTSTIKPKPGKTSTTSAASTTKKKSSGTGGIFAAMMLDDSDED
jgi:hypothetical protein